MKHHITFLIGTILFFSGVSAQQSKKIKVENANSLEFDAGVSDAQILRGDVIFSHEGAFLYCDSAYLFENENRLEAFSNVKIISDTVKITGNKLTYLANDKRAVITGNVQLTDPGTLLTTDEIIFNTETRVAQYLNGGKITSSRNKNELISKIGAYHAKEKNFYFKKQVELKNEKYRMTGDTLRYNTLNETAFFLGPTYIFSDENTIYCENGFYNTKSDQSEFGKNAWLKGKTQQIKGDQLYYDRKAGYGRGKGNVIVTDSIQNIKITGHYGVYYENEERITVTDSALFFQNFENDTLVLHADTLKSYTLGIDNARIMKALNKAQFFKNDLQGRCDSLIYSYADSVMRMYGKPIIWSDVNQLTGTFTTLHLKNKTLDHLILHENGLIASIEDSVRFNQIKGKEVKGIFKNSELNKIEVRGNGQTIYYAKDDKEEYIGINRAFCTDMDIYVDSNQVQEIVFKNQPDAVLYPANELTYKEWLLKDFKWYGYLRPRSRNDLFIWKTETVD